MELKKLGGITAAAFVAMGAGYHGQSDAATVAQASMVVTDFVITNGTSGTGNALDFADFSQLTFLDTLQNFAQLNGTPASNFASSTIFQPVVDALQSCVGTCGAQNVFTVGAVPPGVTFARSDSLLKDAPIAGTGVAVGADASTVGETYLRGDAFGSSTSDEILNSSFTFVLAKPVASIGFGFSADTLLRTWTEAGSKAPSSAGAEFKWELTLKDGDITLADWIPNGNVANGTQTGLDVTVEGCNLSKSSSATFNDPQALQSCTGNFFATTTFALLAGKSYSFVLTQNVKTQAQSVPEPASLALVGVALMGLGAIRRRRA